MTLQVQPSQLGKGGSNLVDGVLATLLREGARKVAMVAGVAAGTKINIAAMREEDTIINVLLQDGTTKLFTGVDDAANCTCQSTRSKGTITITGNPVAAEVMTINDVVYTWRAAGTLTDPRDVKITAGDNNAMAASLAAAINAYETRRASVTPTGSTPTSDASKTANVTAVASTNTVVVTSVVDGPGNAPNVVGSDADLTVAANQTASVTVTLSGVDVADTLTVNGIVFTARAVPALDIDFLVNNADNTQQAINLRNALNAYEFKYGTLGITASAAAAVVTIVPNRPKEGNIITFTESVTNLAMDGGGVLGGTNSGTVTGGFKSTTNLAAVAGTMLYVVWADKLA